MTFVPCVFMELPYESEYKRKFDLESESNLKMTFFADNGEISKDFDEGTKFGFASIIVVIDEEEFVCKSINLVVDERDDKDDYCGD